MEKNSAQQRSVDYSRDRAEVRFEACFDSLFAIFFPATAYR